MPESRPIQHFVNGVLVGTTPYTVDDAQLRLDAVITRLKAGRSRLRQIRNQARIVADSNAVLTLGQLTTQFRTLCGALADVTQDLMDVEVLARFNDDDGND